MAEVPDELLRARAHWRWRGQARPPFADEPGPGQRSVWDFPRPPAIEDEPRRARVALGETVVAESTRCLRVCETASPPTVYFPPEDVLASALGAVSGRSVCEWKGVALSFDVESGQTRAAGAAWSYPDPFPEFAPIAGWIAFLPSRLTCSLDGEPVRPQDGGYYGGWWTSDWSGPGKGAPGSEGW